MDEFQRQKATAWLDTHLAPRCPSCLQPGPFQAVDKLVSPPLMTGGTVDLGSTLPCVALVCVNCSGVRFFSAIMMGVMERKTEIEGGPEAAKG
jgi:hypothetical protein